jgi:hypothetical protein
MEKCIYCLQSQPKVTFGSKGEHVIPQAFGKFGSQTPLLKCVCIECNNKLGRDLDQVLARDSLEAMQRYKHGIRSSEEKRPHGRVTMKLAEEEKPEGVPTLEVTMDGSAGKVNFKHGFTLKKQETGEAISVTKESVDEFEIEPWLKGVDVIMVGDTDDMKYIFEHLQERGMTFLKPFEYTMLTDLFPTEGELLIESTGVVDETIKRAVTKILFNFTAHYVDPSVVLAPEWQIARKYIRDGEGELQIEVKRGIFWNMETEHILLDPPGTNIRIENKNGDLWGYIQFFNMMIYEIKLAEGYQLPDKKLIGGKFSPGEEPLIIKPVRIRVPLYVAQYDVDEKGNVKLQVRKYGG